MSRYVAYVRLFGFGTLSSSGGERMMRIRVSLPI